MNIKDVLKWQNGFRQLHQKTDKKTDITLKRSGYYPERFGF
jgi:lipid II:glycine glycyltransferase (peptidoglycan interpeptide bridge formation enzyme)